MIFDAYDGNKKKKRVGVPVKQNACRSGDLPLKHSPIVDENICSKGYLQIQQKISQRF